MAANEVANRNSFFYGSGGWNYEDKVPTGPGLPWGLQGRPLPPAAAVSRPSCGCITPVSASVFSFVLRTLVIGLRPYLGNLGRSHFKILNLITPTKTLLSTERHNHRFCELGRGHIFWAPLFNPLRGSLFVF